MNAGAAWWRWWKLRLAFFEALGYVPGLVARLQKREIAAEGGGYKGDRARRIFQRLGIPLQKGRKPSFIDWDDTWLVDRNWAERQAAAEALGRVRNPRAIEALERAANSDPAETVKAAARHALSAFSEELARQSHERSQMLRAAAETQAADQASRDGAAGHHVEAADAAVRAGRLVDAVAAYRRACETGGANTLEALVARRRELEERLGTRAATELMVQCLGSLAEYYREHGFQSRAQSCAARLRDARKKLAKIG
jgi:tetratricopeptide (TPR) repeat protein